MLNKLDEFYTTHSKSILKYLQQEIYLIIFLLTYISVPLQIYKGFIDTEV